MTTMTIAPEGTMTELVEHETSRHTAVRKFTHEDGSVTVIHHEEYTGDFDPRENGDPCARLVSESDKYVALDDPDYDIAKARDEAEEALGRGAGTTVWAEPTGAWRYKEHDGTNYLVLEIKRDYGAGWSLGEHYLDLDDEVEGWIAKSYFLGHTAEEAVQHYIDQARPDIAAYQHHWSVTGSSQGDWREGYAFVTRDDLARAGYSMREDRPLSGTYKMRARSIIEAELKEYGAWFAGEVYRAVHIAPAGQEYEIGDHGGYYTGETLGTTEHCGGFIGYDELSQICEQFTDSPIVEEAWV